MHHLAAYYTSRVWQNMSGFGAWGKSSRNKKARTKCLAVKFLLYFLLRKAGISKSSVEKGLMSSSALTFKGLGF